MATGLFIGGGFHTVKASELTFDLNKLESFSQQQNSTYASSQLAPMSIASDAAGGGADATEVYVISRLQDQAEATDNKELKALLASATTDKQAAQLAGELTPDRSGVSVYGVIQAQDLFTNAIRKRTSDYVLGASARNSMWVSYLSSDNNMTISSDGANRYDGFDATSAGVAVGLEKLLSAETLVGVAFSQQQVDAESRLYNKTTKIESYQVAAYGTTSVSDWYFSGRGVLGWNAQTTQRTVGQSSGYDGNTDVTGRYNGQNLALQFDAIYPVYWKDLTVLPTLSANYTLVKVEDYQEHYIREYTKKGVLEKSSGSPAALAYDEQSYQEMNLALGLEAAYSFYFDKGVLQTRLGSSASVEVLDDELTSTARLASGGDRFTVGANDRESMRYSAYASLLWETDGNLSLSATAEQAWDDKAENLMLYGRAVYAF